ncbi:MAG: LysR family transcriptional regulator [Mollicutes bacterium]|nr:LysR family transcriptional regulator [Mollicutes bacterium]
MNILHLKYAIAVSETGSISKAAERLYVAQPNVSRAIKDLESDLGITIFERTKKGIALTPDGERLVEYSKRLLNQFDEMEKIFKGQQKKNVFSIAVPRASYVSNAFVEFSKTLNNIDNIEAFYKETNAYRVIHNIMEENYKLGIVRYYAEHDKYFKELFDKKELNYELINEFNYVLVFNNDSPLAKLTEITQQDLKDLMEIAHGDPYVPSLPVTEVSKSAFSEGINKRIFVFERASQFELLASNANTFMWVSPIPESTLKRYGLIQKACADNVKKYKDVLIYRKSYVLSNLDNEFITKLCESKRKNSYK